MLSLPYLIIFLYALSYAVFTEYLSLERNLKLGDNWINKDLFPFLCDRANTYVASCLGEFLECYV